MHRLTAATAAAAVEKHIIVEALAPPGSVWVGRCWLVCFSLRKMSKARASL